jgi:hypothetical protein
MEYRIVCTDNFGRSGESPGCDEAWIGEPSTDKRKLEKEAFDLNNAGPIDSSDYYVIRQLPYKLRVFKP